MFPILSLLTALLLAQALCASSNPVVVTRPRVSLALSRRLNLTSAHSLVRHDQARARFLKQRGAAQADLGTLTSAKVVNEPVENQGVTYVASIEVGSPATTYELLVDTGSSNTWVGANKAYLQTNTSVKTEDSVIVSYGSGSFSGTEFLDQVTLAPGLVIHNQSIGVASSSSGFSGLDGILGIGPVDLTVGTLSPDSAHTVPTLTDNLFTSGTISAHSIGISFEPAGPDSLTNGEITWGGTDSSKFTGPITFIPVTSTQPASFYWGIDQSIRYGPSATSILSETAGIVDTGTTLVLLATDAFKRYKSATGAVEDITTGLLRITPSQLAKLQSLFFTAGGATFELTPNAQLWPRALNKDIGGNANDIYLIINDLGSPSGQGLDFINGFGFLERFYSVYDTANARVGLANTPFTKAVSN